MMGASTTTTMARCRHPAGYDMRRGHDPVARGSDARGHGCGGARARTGGGDVNCSSRSTASLVHRSPITSCTNSERLDPVAARACAACNLAMEDAIAQGDFFFRCPGRNGQRRRVGAAGLRVSAFGRPGFARTRQPSSLAWARPRSARRARHGKSLAKYDHACRRKYTAHRRDRRSSRTGGTPTDRFGIWWRSPASLAVIKELASVHRHVFHRLMPHLGQVIVVQSARPLQSSSQKNCLKAVAAYY